jgi:hypothetical protein
VAFARRLDGDEVVTALNVLSDPYEFRLPRVLRQTLLTSDERCRARIEGAETVLTLPGLSGLMLK